ncbi:MAG TPA: Uma2 family endonuclease [Polyangium sp.]|nr:Uma2 family endonuclease [Polyangium sp.]
MGEPARKLETYEDVRPVPTFEETWRKIELLPEGVTGEILEPGIITTMSRPLARHRRGARNLLDALRGLDAGVGGVGWWIEHEPDVRFGDRTTAPDIAGWRVERCPDPPDGSPIILLPDFCCEVLSPSTEHKDRTKKLPLYARYGVEWVWLVNTDYRFVEVHQTVNGIAGLVDSAEYTDIKKLPPFDIEIDFSRFWILPKNPEPTTAQPST